MLSCLFFSRIRSPYRNFWVFILLYCAFTPSQLHALLLHWVCGQHVEVFERSTRVFVLFYWHWHHHLQHLQVDPGWSVGPEAPWAAQPLQSRLHNYENKFLYLLEVPCLIHQGYIKLFIHLEMLTTLNCVAQNLLIFLTTFSLYFPLCSCLNPRD